jgi:hypothetical protein
MNKQTIIDGLRHHAEHDRRLHRSVRTLLEEAANHLEEASEQDNFEDLERTTRLPVLMRA